MWTLCIDDDANNRTVLKLARSEYLIGRAEGSNIRLTERNVSRRHALLTLQGGHWLLTDLESDNGCFVNGRRLVAPVVLAHGDFLQLGDYRLRISDDNVARTQPELEDDTLRAVPEGARQDQSDRLIVLTGPNTGAVYPLHSGSILIGRGEECEIALTDTSVSRVHAEIVGTETGYELLDRGSANGLHVNGVELAQTFLEPSDVIELGDVLLKFVPKGELLLNPVAAVPSDADANQEIPPSLPPSFAPESEPWPVPRKNRTTLVASLLLLCAIVLGFFILRRQPEIAAEPPPIRAAPPSPAALAVQEAKKLYAEGNLTQAHDKLRELPADSNLRQATEVMDIERGWAEAIFEMVDAEPDPANKKTLLREIAATEGINSAQRKRAAAQLQSLEAPSVEVNQLPVEEPAPVPATGSQGTPGSSPASAEPSPQHEQQAVIARPKKEPTPKKAAPKEPPVEDAPAAPPAPPPKDDGLIRKSPFGD